MSAILLQFWPYIVGAFGILAGLWKVYAMGKASEKAKQASSEVKARDIRDQVQNDVGALPADKARVEAKKWSRD